MRWCRVRAVDGPHHAIVEGHSAHLTDGGPFGPYRRTGHVVPLDAVEFLPPVVPGTFFCAGLNYKSHVRHAAEHGMPGAAVPDRPEVGYRANSALVGQGMPIVKPADCTGRFETEGELVAVIGRPLRRCSRQEAADAIFGWTIGNDVSARDWQHADRTLWRAKNSDTFKPMGPWIDTDVDPMQSTTTITVNGEACAEFPTGDMIFDAVDFLCAISRYITVLPSDVLWLGTDGVVGMQPGDTVSISITGIGTLTNPVHLEEIE